MKNQRKSISKKIRFEILKRDNFICMYCGAKAPDTILVIDHIKPVKNGGTSDIENLVTSCEDCNQGKSCRELKDNQVVSKSFNQLQIENKKIQQLKDTMKWREEIVKNKLKEENLIIKHLQKVTKITLSEYGCENILKAYKKYGMEDCQEYLSSYLEDDTKRVENERKRYTLSEYIDFTKNKDNPKYKKKYLMVIGLAHFSKSFCYDYLSKMIDIFDSESEIIEIEKRLKSVPYKEYWRDDKAYELFEGFLIKKNKYDF